MSKKDSVFIKLLKKHTTIDEDFIDTFFKKFKIGGELDFEIEDNKIAKYLGIEVKTLRDRLLNRYSKKKLYFENADYVKTKSDTSNAGVTYMVNYQCFERLAMLGDSEGSEVVRLYFMKLREFITDNQQTIFQAMENKQDLKKYEGMESIYFFAVDDRKFNFKIGRTDDIVKRLRNYNVGRIMEVDLKYYALVKHSILIEKCMKFKLKAQQVIKNREIYEIDPEKLKKVISDCYCKYVKNKDQNELYDEISSLLGMYVYTKDKINIKPYIIIGKRAETKLEEILKKSKSDNKKKSKTESKSDNKPKKVVKKVTKK